MENIRIVAKGSLNKNGRDAGDWTKNQNFMSKSTDKSIGCPFCKPNGEREIIVETETAYAIFDGYPVNEGHALVIPKRHCANYFELTLDEQYACMTMINKVWDIVKQRFEPDGFNIGVNIGHAAGQTVDHVHVHLIPRFRGDVDNPMGGVRGVIPSKQKY